jgi:hypothetical protein
MQSGFIDKFVYLLKFINMKNYFVLLLPILFALQSCKPSADGLFKKIESETGFKLTINPRGSDEFTKSMNVSVPKTADNIKKIERIPDIIDAYLKMVITKDRSDFNVVKTERLQWENSEFDVLLKITHFPDDFSVIIFYTTK